MSTKKINIQKIANFLELKLKTHDCPACGVSGQDKIIIANKVFELREFQHGSFVISNNMIMPLIALVCNNCTYTRLFNLHVMAQKEPQILEDDEEIKEEEIKNEIENIDKDNDDKTWH